MDGWMHEKQCEYMAGMLSFLSFLLSTIIIIKHNNDTPHASTDISSEERFHHAVDTAHDAASLSIDIAERGRKERKESH